MTRTQKAAKLGISDNYFSQIYHGRRKPSLKLAEQWKEIIGKGYDWWLKADTKKIQKVLNAI